MVTAGNKREASFFDAFGFHVQIFVKNVKALKKKIYCILLLFLKLNPEVESKLLFIFHLSTTIFAFCIKLHVFIFAVWLCL